MGLEAEFHPCSAVGVGAGAAQGFQHPLLEILYEYPGSGACGWWLGHIWTCHLHLLRPEEQQLVMGLAKTQNSPK